MRVSVNATLLLQAQQVPFASLYASPTGVSSLTRGPTNFTAAGAFPTDAFKHYYNEPTQTTQQVQPVITDPISSKIYPLELTDPRAVPTNNAVDRHLFPPAASKHALLANAIYQIDSIVSSQYLKSNCSKCIASLEVAKFVVLAEPKLGPKLAVALCIKYKTEWKSQRDSRCHSTYNEHGLGAVITQVISFADVGGYDGQMLCNSFVNGTCPRPPPTPLDLASWFKKPKPDPLPEPKRSGQRVKVLHLSDIHLDPRYLNGAEAACNSTAEDTFARMCCRYGVYNGTVGRHETVLPAPRFGAWLCDTPLALTMASLEAIPVLAGTEDTGFAWSIYTGDLVAHDADNELSRDYVMYTESLVYDLMRRYLGSGPMYVALGNHDSYNHAQDSPHSLGGPLENQYSWNYDHVAALWEYESWLPSVAVASARAHYGGYSVQREDGLRIITLNTDMWLTSNFFNYINMTADTSGMLRWLTDELQDAEDVGQRVWIVGHVLTGWDGTHALVNPTNLFYQIVDRYSPHVIANIFFGHTHEDHFSIYYTNNATVKTAATAMAVSWIGPSITPLKHLNSGFRVYEVDSGSFEIMDAHTWISNVSSFSALEGQIEQGPTYEYEYSTRDAYNQSITWGKDDPLNATWWHMVTAEMNNSVALVQKFTKFQSKSSDWNPQCTSADCISAKICYMRSASTSIAADCKPGYGSVQN
ncbi:sphingomyelin phosphodiesterase [Auriculariales sp. MPI-PUGE-AT-0066]|nr:sphingomyelin phosphodiesterase [Auriculariales sp. MPI-PUGE-AT-0066]